MVVSRGGISGGFTIADALREFEGRGYSCQFVVRHSGRIECCQCSTRLEPHDVSLEAMRRVEGVSDPADMVFVGAVRCPECGAAGTLTAHYGALAGPDDAKVLRGLDDHRMATELTEQAGRDEAVVKDTGWLRGPDG